MLSGSFSCCLHCGRTFAFWEQWGAKLCCLASFLPPPCCSFSDFSSLFRRCSYRLCLLWRWLVQNRRGLAQGRRKRISCSPEVFKTWLDRVLISWRLKVPWKAGPDHLWKTLPNSVVIVGCKVKSLPSLLEFSSSSFSPLIFFPYRLLFCSFPHKILTLLMEMRSKLSVLT